MYDYIVFDIDGTLIDSKKAAILSLQEALLEETQRRYTYDELRWVFGLPSTVSLSRLDIEDVDKVNRTWMRHLKKNHHLIKVFSDIESVLKKLNEEQVTCGIVTSKTKDELINDFVPFRLMSYFHYVTCADDTKKHKPDPEPILKFITLSNAESGKTLYVGDTIYDMKCARAAGVHFALASWGAGDKEIPTEHKLKNPMDLLGLIKEGATV